MLKQSDAFNTVFNSDQRTLAVKFTVADKDYTADDLASIDYDSGAMTGESMGIGTAYENSVTITFANLIEGIKDQDQVTVSIGAQLPDGTFEYAPLGVFYVNNDISMDRNNNVTTITADDGMCKMEGVYTPKVTLPVSIADMALDIANQTGVMVNSDNLSALPKQAVAELPKNQTYRTVLGWLAMMVPGYAAFDRDGKLCLKGITQPTYEVTPETYEFQGLTKNENPYTVAGIVIAQDDDSDYSATDGGGNDTSVTDDTEYADTDGTDDTTKSISVGATTGSIISTSNPLMTQDALNAAWKIIQPIQYYQYTLNWFGNPAVEAGDWLVVSDTAGNKFTVPNNSYTMTFGGGYSATSSTGESVTSSGTWDYNGTLNQTIKEIVRQTNASGTYSYFTVSDPANPSEGDIWYKPNGEKVTLYIYSNGAWKPIVDDMTGQQIQQSVADAQADIKTAKAVADAANTLATNNQNALQSKLGNDEFNTAVSQLNNDINLRVKTGDVISQINLEANQTLIESGKILLDAPTVTFSGNAFIPSAAISDLSADKLTAGTIDANTVNIINLNGDSISSKSITGDKLSVNAIQAGFNDMGNVMNIDSSSLNFYNGGNQVLSLNQTGLEIWESGVEVGEIHANIYADEPNYRGLDFDLSENADYMAWAAKDSSTSPYYAKLTWNRNTHDGLEAGFSFADPVMFQSQVEALKGMQLDGTLNMAYNDIINAAVNDIQIGNIAPIGGGINNSVINFSNETVGTHNGILIGAGSGHGIFIGPDTIFLLFGGGVYNMYEVIKSIGTGETW
ncbi:hypothetical protein AZI11_08185 [Levilactobacillus brevis]|uniref:hypothetical protein n=1 Tax=Levilactobacillus brevis TaxID=1580 RepID=UPI000A20227C|nr:hypothetical protein [Levilactobacillus brevis]ARN92881.1 hypothetical protein AZI11_08185 [Levilactobacillus brevis]ARN95524.1 hypothetical protein AZI12_08230 [Levilactobacillus brevis]MBS0978667.1 hypothetical protein [Levilactobacillus brevis]